MTIGKAIRLAREENKFSLEELAERCGYSSDYIRKLEYDMFRPSQDILSNMSKALNVDLIHYHNMYENFQSLEASNYYMEIRNAIIKRDVNRIKELVEKAEGIKGFQEGENQQLVYYCKSLISLDIDKDLESAKENCLKGLRIDKPDFDINMIENTVFSNTSYSLLIILGSPLINTDKNIQKHIVKSLVKNFETVVYDRLLSLKKHDQELRTIYLVASNNLADLYFQDEEYSKSLEVCERVIELSLEYNDFFVSELLYSLKMENLYCLGEIDQSVEAFKDFKYACKLKQNLMYFEIITRRIEEKYPILRKRTLL